MRWLGVLVAVLAAPAAAQGSTITLEVRHEPNYRGAPDYVAAIAHIVRYDERTAPVTAFIGGAGGERRRG